MVQPPFQDKILSAACLAQPNTKLDECVSYQTNKYSLPKLERSRYCGGTIPGPGRQNFEGFICEF